MRTKNLFRMLAAASLAVISMSAFAQGGLTSGAGALTPQVGAVNSWDNTAANQEAVDIVTVGSKMPYTIDRDVNVADNVTANPTVFYPSVFNWALDVPAAGAFQLPASNAGLTPDDALDGDAVPATTTPIYAGYFYENAVAVKWGNTAGTYQISVSEQSQNNAGLQACNDATPELINVWVMEKPTIRFNESGLANVNGADIRGTSTGDNIIGGCGVTDVTAPLTTTKILLPFIATGVDQYQITYTTDQFTLAGVPVDLNGGAAGTQLTATTARFDDGTNTFLNLSSHAGFTATMNTINDFFVDVPANTYGKWVITVTGITDRISRKSLADSNGDGTADDQDMGTVISAAGVNTLTLFSLPTPTTGKIQHKSNAQAW